MKFTFGPRRATHVQIDAEDARRESQLPEESVKHYETFDLLYRALIAMCYNYVPLSGHPGGSISSGRFAAMLAFGVLDYDMSNPDRPDADVLSYAAGHKALGLYSLWSLRNEIARIAAPDLLPESLREQLRLEDMLGFRKNPLTGTALFKKFSTKALDGHPTPATPFVRLATGASGVGIASSIGLALAARDYYGESAPMVHVIEGEGGMTPGRVSEAFAAAGSACLSNVVVHVDWNQASIDSDAVCRLDANPGDYVQWDPAEFAYLHDWNVIAVPDGTDFHQIAAAHRAAARLDNKQPTAIVYRTQKGWRYGIEGRKSHGAGHSLCSKGFLDVLKPLIDDAKVSIPFCENGEQQCRGGKADDIVEKCFWEALTAIRAELERKTAMTEYFAHELADARLRLDSRNRTPRKDRPSLDRVYHVAQNNAVAPPPELLLTAGTATTLRAELGRVLNYYNKAAGGALFVAAADLVDSTSVGTINKGFPEGYYNAATNPRSRKLSIGGICEDAQAGVMSGIAAFGRHIGVCSSYGAFMAPLGHIAARLYAIGCQSRRSVHREEEYTPLILVCAHAGLKTGEDGPTHADPQSLQLLQENFPRGTVITLTPWDPCECWVLVSAALARRPAVICPFVTRPTETVVNRDVLGLAPAQEAAKGVYLLHRAKTENPACVVLQGSEVANEFVNGTLPLLAQAGIEVDAYYVASAELFDMLPPGQQKRIFPEERAQSAIGITGFTLPTMYRWVTSERGRKMTLHPFKKGHYLGSGKAEAVVREAGLDAKSQFDAIAEFLQQSSNSRVAASVTS